MATRKLWNLPAKIAMMIYKLHWEKWEALHNFIKLTILSFRASGARRRACPVLDTGESSIINGFLDTGFRRYDD